MAGLPWFKQAVDLRRDPRSLILGDILGDERAWTYVVEMRMYLAENAPTGCVSGVHADVALERGSGWRGVRGALLSAMREAGFIRTAPAREGDGTEVEDLDWQREQGAHVAKFQRDAQKPDGRAHKVVNPSRDIGGSIAAPERLPRGESRELRVEKEASASQEPLPVPAQGSLLAPEPKVAKRSRAKAAPRLKADKPTDPRHATLSKALVEEIGYPFHGGKDAAAITGLLAVADQQPATRGDAAVPEVLRRAQLAWAQRPSFYSAGSITALLSKWGDLEVPANGGRSRTGPDPNGGVGRTGAAECAGCGEMRMGGTVGSPLVWLGYECGCQGAFSSAMDDGLDYREATEWAKERRDAGRMRADAV
jgi:hypothetical protein